MQEVKGHEIENKAPESELNGLIKKFVEARDLRLNCDRMSKELKIKEDLLEQELWSLLESLNLKSVKTEEYGLISRTFRRDPYVLDFKLFREWVAEQNEWELIGEQAKRQKLRDFISERLKNGLTDAVPPGVEVTVNKIISVKNRGGDSDE